MSKVTKRVITKKHKFTYEMKYKDRVLALKDDKGFEVPQELIKKPELTLELLDSITGDIQFLLNEYKTVDKIMEFLCDFEGIIDFRCLFSNTFNYFDEENLEIIVDRFNKYFDDKCWDLITEDIQLSYINFIRKYKDKINWKKIEYRNVSMDFYLEFKDYLDIDKVILYLDNKFKSHITKYLKDHLEEIIAYKGDEDNVTTKEE